MNHQTKRRLTRRQTLGFAGLAGAAYAAGPLGGLVKFRSTLGSVVIGERFAWAHVPKTGGDATQAMLAAVPGLVLFADPRESNDKHLAFWNRQEEVDGKLLVMNIRRLPAWILSSAQHKARSGLHPEFKPLPMSSSEEMAENLDPSDMLRWMTHGNRIDRWLRTEHLVDDVIALLDELGALDAEVAVRVRAVGRRNASVYDHDLARYFSAKQVRQMYARNPEWAEIERAAFGDLLYQAAAPSGRA